MLFVLTIDHIENVFLRFLMYGHRNLDIKFVHGRAEIEVGSNKICPKRSYKKLIIKHAIYTFLNMINR